MSNSKFCSVDFEPPEEFQNAPVRVVDGGFPRGYTTSTHLLAADNRVTIMAHSNRRQFLKDLLGTLAQGAGTIVLATSATARALADSPGDENSDIQKRAEDLPGGVNEQDLQVSFFNRAFRNGIGGGFRNGGFRNAGFGGGFRNGGFRNGYGGGFRNGAFRNW
jgi:hypothetical protein